MSYDTGFSRRSGSERDLQSVAITSVDPVSRFAVGVTRTRHTVRINCAYATGDTITTPAVGEQWYCERFGGEWRLYGRIPFNDATLNIEPEEGQVLVGSASGPLELNGTEVRSNGTVFRLNGIYYRDDGETLQRSADKEVWEPISGTAAGAIQLIGNALSGIPVTEDVAGFLERLGDEETETLQALAEWAQGLGDEIGNAWNVACDNPFFTSLRELGSGDRPIDQVVTGFQAFVNDLWGTLFCGFTGNLTPQTALTGLGGISGLLAANPLIQGLADLIGDSAVGNLAVDAISGANEFLQQLVDLLLCNFTGELTPQGILDAISEVLTPLTESPFIQGLSSLADTLGTGVGNLFQDAIAGATGLVQAVFGAIFCDFSGDFTPQAMIAKLTEVLTSITENPFVAGLISFAESLGHNVGGGIEKAFAGANELLESLFGVFFCDNEGVPTPQVILDSVSGVVDYIRTNPLVAGLVEFIEGIGTTSTGFLQKALEGAFEFFNQIVNTVFCNLPGQPKPAEIMASLVAVIASVTDNPYVAMLRKVAEVAGDTSTNLIQQLMAGITGVFDWFVDLLNTLVPFFDWNQIKTLDFPAMMSGLLNGLNPLAFLGPDGFLPLANLPEIAFDTLTGATAFLQDNIFGPLQSAILGGLDGTLTGGLAALNSFFDGALGAGGSLLQQIADAMTGQGNFVSGPLATLQSLFSGISLGGGNLISQITQTLDEFVTNLDIATIVSKITGIEVNNLPNPLDTLGQFFSGLSSFTGSNTLISQILAQAGSNLKPLVSAITGVAENAIGDVVATASQYFGNFRNLFSMDFGAGFNLPAARDALVGILNSASGGLLSGALISSLDPDKITDLARFITGKINATAADVQAMFGNLRSMFFDPSGAFTLLPGGVFSAASAANAFVVNVLSKATSAIGSVKIPALAIADLGINQISNLISTLTGGATLAEFGNFFTNLRKFLGIGAGAGLVNFLVSPGSFSLVGALNSFISNVLNQATTTINDVLLPSLDITKITDLVGFITGKTSDFANTDLSVFFGNLRGMLNIGTGTGQINLMVNQTVESLQNALFGVVTGANDGINAFLTQSGMSSWLGGNLDLTQIGNFFTNLKTFFGGVSGLGVDLLSGSFNLTTAINSFISGVINKASSGLLNVNLLPSLDITKIGNLIGYITGKTSGFAEGDLNVFFGNFRKMINHGTGTGQINFNASQTEANLRSALFNVVAGINDELGTALNALITNADLAGWLGGSATSQIKTFFDNLKSFLGGINLLSGSFNPATEINKLFTALNAATGTLNPARILSVLGGSSSLVTDLNARPLLTSLTSWLTTSGTANDIQRMFSNLRSVLGLSSVNLLSGFSLSTAQSALFNVVTKMNNTVQTLAKQVDLNLKAGITEIVKSITGGTASSYSDLNQVTSFFSGLSGMTGSSLLAKITYAITGSTTASLLNFFADIRSFFSQGGITLGSLNPVTMIPNFVNGILGASGLIPELNNYSLTIPGVPTAGSYRLSYGGVQTSTISFDATAATIKSRLEALSTIGSGEATVTGSLGEGFQINIDNLSGKLSVSSNTMTGIDNPAPLLERRISTNLIPRLGVDWFPDIGDWVSQRVVSPIVERLTLATGIQLDDVIDIADPLENGLTKLGVWAQRLVSGGFNLDTIIDSVRRAALSVIPVSGIVDESVNLVSQGDFISPTSVPLEDSWSWDATQNHPSSSGGAAKVSITSVKPRQLYSRQSVSVVAGDTLEMSAYVKTTSNFAGTSNPIRIALIPYSRNASGGIVEGSMEELANKGYTTSWSQVKGTYTVPSGVFSVIPLIRVNSAATAGSVWFDGISLVKTGLLRQSLVESLVDVWQGMWDSVFGGGGLNITSASVPTIIDTIFGKATDGVDDAADADGKAQTIVDGIVQALTGSSSTNFLPTNVKTQLQTLFTTLFGQTTPKSRLAEAAIPDVTAGMSSDLQGVLNNIVDALTGTTAGQTSQLPDTFTALDGQRESLSTLAESVSELQSDADQTAQGGTSYTRRFEDFSNFNNDNGLQYLDSGTGFLTINNSQTVWNVGGYGEVRSARGIMTSAFTRTSSQKVGINFATAPDAFSKIYGSAHNYILANSNVGGSQYVFAKFSRTSASLGYTTNGASETIFASGTIYHDFTPGATYYLETTHNGTGTSYRVLRNGAPIGLSVDTTTAYPYRDSELHRYSGFMVKSGAYSLFRNRPGSMTSFSLNDNAPVEVIGSGLRRYRTNATNYGSYNIPNRPSGSSQEYFLLPSNFFNSGTATSDYTYTTSDESPNKFAVSVSGWYQVNINFGLVINDMVMDMAPVLYKNGSVFSKGNSVWGVSAPFVGKRGPSQCGSSFIVYLGADEYVQPGYWQTNAYGNGGTIIASDDGDKTYFEMALMNRSTR